MFWLLKCVRENADWLGERHNKKRTNNANMRAY